MGGGAVRTPNMLQMLISKIQYIFAQIIAKNAIKFQKIEKWKFSIEIVKNCRFLKKN